MARTPDIAPPGGVNRRRHHNHPAIATQINTGIERRAVANWLAGMGEIEVPPASTRLGLQGAGDGADLVLQDLERSFATVTRVDVDDDDPRNRPGDNSDVRLSPTLEPCPNLVGLCPALLKPAPGDERLFAAWRYGDHRPAGLRVGESRSQQV